MNVHQAPFFATSRFARFVFLCWCSAAVVLVAGCDDESGGEPTPSGTATGTGTGSGSDTGTGTDTGSGTGTGTGTNAGGGGAGGSPSTGGAGGATGGNGGAGIGGAGGDAGGGLPTGWAGTVPTLNNDAACMEWVGVHPEVGEEGHLYAVRLAPSSYPFQVTEIVYELLGSSGDCVSSFAHRAEVFVSSSNPPPATPTVTTLNIPSGTDAPVRIVAETLSSPITLSAGEYLYVAVELPSTTSCIAACNNAPVADFDYWSNAASAPYNWATLASFGLDTHARIGANGQ